MTLATAFVLEERPFVFSDLLITFDIGEEQHGLSLPATGLVAELPRIRPRVHGLRQKLVVVADNLVVAFAGDVLHAIAGLQALRAMAEGGPLTWPAVHGFFQSRLSLRRVALVGFFSEHVHGDEYLMRRIQVRGETIDVGYVGKIDVAGTGTDLMVEICQYIGTSGFERLPNGLRQLCKVVSMCGALTRQEHATNLSIVHAATGGAYEIAHFEDGRFQKVEITFVVWYVNLLEAQIDVKQPFLIIKSLYVQDDLVLNCARWTCEADGSEQRWNLSTHAIPPGYRDRVVNKLPRPEEIGFESPITQHAILLMLGDESELFSVIEPGRSSFRAVEANGTITIPFCREVHEGLLQVVRDSRLGNRARSPQ